VSRAVLDTSVLIARGQEEPLARALPDTVAVSVISIAELEIGVLVAREEHARAQRLRTLTEVRSRASSLPIDERTASAYAQLAAAVIAAGRKPRIHDTWIAATALTNDAEVWTRDADFSHFEQQVTVVQV
jgi:predicted nucleic acid-binding protein